MAGVAIKMKNIFVKTTAILLQFYLFLFYKLFNSVCIGFKRYLRVLGVGFKFLVHKNNVETFVGFSHILFKKFSDEFKIHVTKKQRMLKIESRSFQVLNKQLYELFLLRRPNVFTGKGLRFRREFYFKKEGKKRKKF